MFLTVTPNSALDRVFFIDRFIPGSVLRTRKLVESVGGKGMDASVVLRAMKQETLALGFVAGDSGKTLVRLLEGYGVQTDLVWVDGKTRIAYVIVEMQEHRHTHLIVGGFSITTHAYDELIEHYHRWLPHAQWVLTGGSIPEGFPSEGYQRLASIAKENHVPILIDCSGILARAAAQALPTILKMNQSEFFETFGESLNSHEGLLKAAQAVKGIYHLENLVITRGEEGILALTEQGAYQATAPRQIAVNAAGAGDAASAALVWRLSQGDPWPEALRWAAATGAAVVLTPGTADCRLEDIHQIYAQSEAQCL
jgi:1-phosphofructokinase family hexose kinase